MSDDIVERDTTNNSENVEGVRGIAKSDFNRLGWFIVGLIVLSGVLGKVGGWALPAMIGGIVTVVAGHELGHYVAARASKMRVTDFFIGFGPVIWSIDRGGTRYGVRAFLLGGYVKVPGMTWEENVVSYKEEETYRSKATWRRVVFALAGPAMNGVMALVLAWSALVFVGTPSSHQLAIGSLASWNGHVTPAATAHLQAGDVILSVNHVAIHSETALSQQIGSHVGQRISVVVQRGGHDVTLSAVPVDGRKIIVNGTALASGAKPVGFLGIDITAATVHVGPLAGISKASGEVGTTARLSVSGLVHVFSFGQFSNLIHEVVSPHSVSTKVANSRPESVVGVVRIAVQGASQGVGILFFILMSVNIFVGLFNLIPILPLDGGYVAISLYERVRSRRGVRHHTDMRKLVPVVYAFVAVLGVLFLSTLYLDIVHPIANPFS